MTMCPQQDKSERFPPTFFFFQFLCGVVTKSETHTEVRPVRDGLNHLANLRDSLHQAPFESHLHGHGAARTAAASTFQLQPYHRPIDLHHAHVTSVARVSTAGDDQRETSIHLANYEDQRLANCSHHVEENYRFQ